MSDTHNVIPVGDEVKLHLQKNMLEFHCGHTLFCPGCGEVMDAPNAVACDFYQDGEPGTEPKLVKTGVLCAGCYDKRAEVFKAAAFKRGLRMEVIDGRNLFPQKRRAKAARRGR